MKREFSLALEGTEYPVVAEGDSITVNGCPFTVEVTDGGAVLVDGILYDVTLEGESAVVGGKNYHVQVSGLSTVSVAPSSSPGGTATQGSVETGAGAVLAIMPGKIVRVLVEPGQQVEEGDPVCVLEAMKMENELHARQGGIVRALHVRPGDDVEKDQVLIEIE